VENWLWKRLWTCHKTGHRVNEHVRSADFCGMSMKLKYYVDYAGLPKALENQMRQVIHYGNAFI